MDRLILYDKLNDSELKEIVDYGNEKVVDAFDRIISSIKDGYGMIIFKKKLIISLEVMKEFHIKEKTEVEKHESKTNN